MERRVLLAIFLCFLSLYLWQAVMVKPVPKPAPRRHRDVRRLRAGRAQPPRRSARGEAGCRRFESGAAGRGAARRRRERARDSRRHARCDRGVHQPRRAPQELAPEALSRSPDAAAGAGGERSRRRSRSRSRSASRTTANEHGSEQRAVRRERRPLRSVSRVVADTAAVRILHRRERAARRQGIRDSSRRLHPDRQDDGDRRDGG